MVHCCHCCNQRDVKPTTQSGAWKGLVLEILAYSSECFILWSENKEQPALNPVNAAPVFNLTNQHPGSLRLSFCPLTMRISG